MPHDICINSHTPSPKSALFSTALIAALLLGGLSLWVLSAPTSPADQTGAAPSVSQDWHGNVMRSHWAR